MDKNQEILIRWRKILGGGEADGTEEELEGEDLQKDQMLDALYEFDSRGSFEYQKPESKKKQAGKSSSAPGIARWLGDIRRYFPTPLATMIQNDALEKPPLKKAMLMDPEILKESKPNIELVATLMEMKDLIPDETKHTARLVVAELVKELVKQMEVDLVQAIRGALAKSIKNFRPQKNEIDWNNTILKNLKHYQPKYKTVIPVQKIGFSRRNRKKLKRVMLCLDQSGSMASSIVYAGIMASVMAKIPAMETQLYLFDTEIVNVTEELDNPVDLLFGIQLGGGTYINKMLAHVCNEITNPEETVLVLITDLYEGGSFDEVLMHCENLINLGVKIITLLALDDEGTTSYSHTNAKSLAALGVPTFSCTPQLFPSMMAKALSGNDLQTWASENNIVLS